MRRGRRRWTRERWPLPRARVPACRVARLLLDTAHPVAGEWVVDIGAEEIARTVGASREMVSRVVKQMIEAGLLRRDKRKIVVLDRSSLPTPSAVLH